MLACISQSENLVVAIFITLCSSTNGQYDDMEMPICTLWIFFYYRYYPQCPLSFPWKWRRNYLCQILGYKPYPIGFGIAKALNGLYQGGFRHGKFNINQKFTLRQSLKKTYENHHIFVNYKSTFSSPTRNRILAAMSDLGISGWLIRWLWATK